MAERNRKKANITEVARAAGVSVMTVSRLLNHACKVAPSTRTRIQRVIDELEYTPNPIARGLVTNRIRIIGLMFFDDVEGELFRQTLTGAQQKVSSSDYKLLIFSPAGGKKVLDDRYLSLVDGVLCIGGRMDNETIEKLEQEGVPHVVIGRRDWRRADPWFCAPDYVKSFLEAGRYLINMGHRKIMMAGPARNFEPDADKIAGYKQALAEAGIPFKPDWVLFSDEAGKLRSRVEAVQPTAVIVESDKNLLSFLLYARDRGLSIPRQLSVICCDCNIDTHILHSLIGIHELTAVEVPGRELGISGIDLLLRLVQGERNIPKARWLDTIFTRGESCAPPPGRAEGI
jgi:DNA-binding LacI/PurR family transcriptional regulator